MVSGMLDGKYALVTGGSQGVGQGIARAFARAGVAGIVIAQRNRERGEQEAAYLRDTYDIDAHSIVTDVAKGEQVDAMVAETIARFGRLDILVNNAGSLTAIKRLENHTDEDMAYSFDVNYWSAFWAMRAVFPQMKAQKYGRIINMGSLNGVNAHMFSVAYNASKEALRTLSRSAAVEWGGHGISVNVICPFALSESARHAFEADPELAKNLANQVPAGRSGEAERDIGSAAVFLASEGSGYTNGNTLFVSGGSHINGITWRPEVED